MCASTQRRVSDAAADFGFSRPSFYAARAAFQRAGLPGLLPQKRGPRQPHKLTDDVLAFLATVARRRRLRPAHDGVSGGVEGPVRDHRTPSQHRTQSAEVHRAPGKKTTLTAWRGTERSTDVRSAIRSTTGAGDRHQRTAPWCGTCGAAPGRSCLVGACSACLHQFVAITSYSWHSLGADRARR